jgi:hypothetical protein
MLDPRLREVDKTVLLIHMSDRTAGTRRYSAIYFEIGPTATYMERAATRERVRQTTANILAVCSDPTKTKLPRSRPSLQTLSPVVHRFCTIGLGKSKKCQ